MSDIRIEALEERVAELEATIKMAIGGCEALVLWNKGASKKDLESIGKTLKQSLNK